jgi:hypothetical protein
VSAPHAGFAPARHHVPLRHLAYHLDVDPVEGAVEVRMEPPELPGPVHRRIAEPVEDGVRRHRVGVGSEFDGIGRAGGAQACRM